MVNKRIDELFGQALDAAVPETWTTLNMMQVKLLKDKFAELIVNDAVELVRDIMRDEESELSLMAGAEVQARMREYFGDTVIHDFRLSSKDNVDGTGMPDIDKIERATYWTRPAFIPKEDGKMHLIFLDEVGHASIQIYFSRGRKGET